MSIEIKEKQFAFFEQTGLRRRLRPGSFTGTNDTEDTIYLLEKGRLSVCAQISEDTLIPLEELKKGYVFSVLSFSDLCECPIRFRAETDCEVIACRRDRLYDASSESRKMLMQLLKFETENSRILKFCIQKAGWTGKMKLADYLIRSVDNENGLAVTHEDLSVLLNMNRITVTRLMKQLKDQNLIDYKSGQIQILDPSGLRKMVPDNL